MARLLKSLVSRFVLGALAIQLLLAPLLFIGVTKVVEDSSIDLFVNDVGAYSRFLAELLEFEISSANDNELVDFLDSVMLSREAIRAEIVGGPRDLRSRLIDDRSPDYVEDFRFAEHGDDTYFVSIPLNAARAPGAVLRVGFDERNVLDSIAGARTQTLWILSAFVGSSLLLVATFAFVLGRPLRDLQRASQTVASGNYDEQFDVASQVTEILELARDLERMRGKLVAANLQLSAEAEERIKSERARASLERRLLHAQRLETMGTLAGGIAHEFNNVLVPIKMYTELALDDVVDKPDLRRNLERVVAAAMRARNVVQKILTFSRQSPQDGYRRVDVAAIVEDALELAKTVFPATVQVGASLDRDATIFGSESEIHQLTMNLLNNGAQAIGPRGGRIMVTVTCRSLTATDIAAGLRLVPGDHVVVAVSDTGHGMDAATQERIFEPFFTTKGPGLGTGLGLSVVHGIVANHGGDIEVRSVADAGTTFAVYLPVGGNPRLRLQQLGMERILYVVGGDVANDASATATATAIGARLATVGERDELADLLALDTSVDLLILDVGSKRGQPLHSDRLIAALAGVRRVLVVGGSDADWDDIARRVPRLERCPRALDPAIVCEFAERWVVPAGDAGDPV